MTADNKSLMERYGIEVETKTVFLYKRYRYDKLDYALRYAEIDHKRESEQFSSLRREKM